MVDVEGVVMVNSRDRVPEPVPPETPLLVLWAENAKREVEGEGDRDVPVEGGRLPRT